MEIKHRTIEKAITMLEAAGAKYHILFDGDEFGEEIEMPKRSDSFYPYGSLSAYIKPHIINMKPGDVAVIEVGEFDISRIRSTTCSIACQLWGTESYTSMKSSDGKSIQILRLA